MNRINKLICMLVFGAGSYLSASAGAMASACAGNADGSVTCDTLDIGTAAQALAAAPPLSDTVVASWWMSNQSGFLSQASIWGPSYTGLINLPVSIATAIDFTALPSGVTDVSGLISRGMANLALYFSGGNLVTGTVKNFYPQQTASISYKLAGDSIATSMSATVFKPNDVGTFSLPVSESPIPAPGPLAGTGLPVLLGLAGLLWRRGRRSGGPGFTFRQRGLEA